jgi:hypothetical protein
MREKIYLMIESEVEKMPKTSPSKVTPATQAKHVHAAMIVLATLRRQMHWILWKLYGEEDLEFLAQTCTRVQAVLHYLVKEGYFDHPQRRGLLATMVDHIEEIEDELGDLEGNHGIEMKPFWKKGLVVKYQDLVKTYHAKYGSYKHADDTGTGSSSSSSASSSTSASSSSSSSAART